MERPPTARRTRQESGSGCALACTPSRSRVCDASGDEVTGSQLFSAEWFHPDAGRRIGVFDTVLNSPIDRVTLRDPRPIPFAQGDLADRQERERQSSHG